MGVSDPVLYPARRGSAEAVRQDIWRVRVDLEDALGELLTRLDIKTAARRRLRSAGLRVVTDRTAAAGAAAAVLAGIAAAATPRLRWRWRLVAVSVLGILAGSAVFVRRPPAIGPVAASPADGQAALERYPSPPGGDVVDVLLAQHRRIKASFAQVRSATGRDKFDGFTALVELFNRHEHAEQEIVHSMLARLDSAQDVAGQRAAEEAAGDRLLGRLISMGVDDSAFDRQLSVLAAAVARHQAAEESEEFPLLRAHVPPERLQRMANQVRAAQSEPW